MKQTLYFTQTECKSLNKFTEECIMSYLSINMIEGMQVISNVLYSSDQILDKKKSSQLFVTWECKHVKLCCTTHRTKQDLKETIGFLS